jgi:amidohydrolase
LKEQIEKISSACEKYRALMQECERYLWKHPESGYREWLATEYLSKKLENFGYRLTMASDIPGFFTEFDTGLAGPTVLVLAELDSLISCAHEERDKETGYVHACGHNVQPAVLLGIAGALKEAELSKALCGKIRLCCVPAEEMIESEFRKELIKEGKIKYLTGKCEFLHRGYFEGCDIAFMVHASNKFAVTLGNVGAVFKSVNYKGVSAHAGGCPWLGVNALYSSTLGLNAVNALRETFKDEDLIKFHPIITHGGGAVNAIPDSVCMEAYVRGADFGAILETNKRINRALLGGALSMGANIEICDEHCYAPLKNDMKLAELALESAGLIIPEENMEMYRTISAGSTDLGDLSGLIPCVHPYSAGIKGTVHGDDFEIEDTERALIKSAKLQLTMLTLLLKDNATRANSIIESFTPDFKSKEEYFDFIEKIKKPGLRIRYGESDSATVYF